MPKEAPVVHGVLCDTSYFIRWAKADDPLHPAAHAYLKYLVEGGHTLYVSTIALADVVSDITHFLTADAECEKVFRALKTKEHPRFQFVHLSTPWHQAFGQLDLSG